MDTRRLSLAWDDQRTTSSLDNSRSPENTFCTAARHTRFMKRSRSQAAHPIY